MEEARRQLGTDWLQVTVDRSRRANEHEGDIGPDGKEGSTDEPIGIQETEPKQVDNTSLNPLFSFIYVRVCFMAQYC